jgi:hypothetical protein
MPETKTKRRPAAKTKRAAAKTKRPAAKTKRSAAQTKRAATRTKPAAKTKGRAAAQTKRKAAKTKRAAAQTKRAAAKTKPRPAARKRAAAPKRRASQRGPDGRSAADRTAELSEEVLHSLDDGARSAIEAVRRFMEAVDEALPPLGPNASKRQEVTDSAMDMAQRLVHTQYDFLRKVVDTAGKSLGKEATRPKS